MSTEQMPPSIACFGEILWDILPRGIFLGGAPLNVTYHATRLGIEAFPISSVGCDLLGDEALRRIASWGVETNYVTRVRRRATGTVRASLDARGVATYDIATDVAWDRIEVNGELKRRQGPRAVVYGTLALRNDGNRFAFMDLMAAWPCALRVLDLNLRAPYDEGVGIKLALNHAQLVKLNEGELARMTQQADRTVLDLEAAARQFSNEHKSVRVCVTAGARGAGLLWGDQWHWEAGRSVAVRDTVGAGDAFLAGFLAAHLLRSEEPSKAMVAACRLGEFISTQDGAMPPYRIDSRGQPLEADSTSAGDRTPKADVRWSGIT